MSEPSKLRRPVSRRLGDLLVADGLITPEQLQKALQEQKNTDEKLGSILVRLGMLNEDQYIGFLSRQYGIPSITLSQLDVDPELCKLIPAPVAKKYEVLPVKRVGNTLTLAMSDPTNVFALDDVAFLTNLQVMPVVASQAAIRKAIDRSYDKGSGAISEILGDLRAEAVIEGLEEAAGPEAVDENDSVVVRLANQVIMDAYKARASDIHIEPYGAARDTVVRFRVDGVCAEYQKIPGAYRRAVVARLKIMAQLDIAERRKPQDGKIKFKLPEREIELRVAT
ncbi:MAG: Flp pilus assembly complex ATPase component TadA, partial [Candidatus Rokubacteria bacterium]|nr:Flp pilus assembly complex ATPase component TadA [Candidatus Rokubacteria bacterium]